MSDEKLYTLREVSKVLGISYNHLVNNIVAKGQLSTINIGEGSKKLHRVPESVLNSYISSKESAPLSSKRSLMDIVSGIQNINDSIVLYYFSNQYSFIEPNDAMVLIDVIEDIKKRKAIAGRIPRIDLVLNSFGGSLETAYKIVRIIRQYADIFNVIIPVYAKSAATVICLGADNIIMTPLSELGPVDPIIEQPNPNDPTKTQKIPARSIKFFLSYYSNKHRLEADQIDPKIINDLSNKLDPLTAGAYFSVIDTAKEYLNILIGKYMFGGKIDSKKLDSIVNYFTEEHASHGFVIDFEEVKRLGLKSEMAKDQLYDLVKELFSFTNQYMNNNGIIKVIGNEFIKIDIRRLEGSKNG